MEPTASFFIGRTVFIVFGVLFVFGAFFIVKQKTAVIIERLGKFNRVARSGFNLKIPIIDKKAGVVNLKVMELPVEVETKTKDDVFVRLIISVQYYVVETQEGISTSFYKFDNPARQIQSYVFDSVYALCVHVSEGVRLYVCACCLIVVDLVFLCLRVDLHLCVCDVVSVEVCSLVLAAALPFVLELQHGPRVGSF